MTRWCVPSAASCDATLACEPWRSAASADVRALLHAECTRWHIDLGWDLARDWAAVEPARQAGLLSGWVVRDAVRRPRGWAFGVDTPGGRQLGAFVASDRPAADLLFAAAAGGGVQGNTMAFVRAGAVVTADEWRARGFSVQPYGYLLARTDGTVDCGSVWHAADRQETAALLQRAYAADRSVRPFAPDGRIADWLDYVDALTLRPGCGVFSSDASVVVRDGGDVVALALVTSIGATTAHLAQLAVSPSARGRGLGRRVVEAARARAARVLGASRMSLLVSTGNAAAWAVYQRAGFAQASEFIAARQPFLSISTAPATGGESARR